MRGQDELEGFTTVLRALADCLEHIVIVGGWAHRLHRHHADALRGIAPPLYTRDVDLAVTRPPPDFEPPLDRRLRGAGFRERVKGEGQGVTEYLWGNVDPSDESGLSVELLVHRKGNEKAKGLPVGGAIAQRLRFLEVALIDPWSLELTRGDGYPLAEGERLTVRIANPAAFIANKLLVFKRRELLEDKGKDLLYVHDTLRTFASSIQQLARLWKDTNERLSTSQRGRLRREIERIDTPTTIAEEACRIAETTGRTISADRLLETIVHGLEMIRC